MRTRTHPSLFHFFSVLSVALWLFPVDAQERGKVTLVRGGTVLTATDGTIENGSILIRDGKIAEVGRNQAAPAGAEVIDAAGMWIMPGIIDCHSHIAVDGGANEMSLSVTSMVGIGDVIDPTDINIYRDLAGGVTTANILHGSANAIGGQNQVVKLRWGKDAAGLKFNGAPPGIKFALGENPKRGGNPTRPDTTPRYPATRMGVEDVIRDAFNRAREYQRAWKEYRAKKESSRPALPPRKDLELEPLVEVLQGKRLVHSHCYRADEILMLIRLAEEFGFKVATFQHVLEGYKVAREIAAHGAGASTFSDWWAFKIEAWDAIPYNAAIMTREGVVVSINSDSAEEARHLNQEAAKCVRYGGLSEVEALRLITLNPAKQLGIDRWVGSIEKGKDADLVIYNHHPFSTYALPQKVLIDGVVYFDREKDLARRAEVAELKKKLREEDARTSPRRSSTAENAEDAESGNAKCNMQSTKCKMVGPAGFGYDEFAVRTGEIDSWSLLRALPVSLSAASAASAVQSSPVIAIRDARIYPVSGPVIERGTIVIEDGKISALGADVRPPAGAKVIDGRGLSVYPGMIDAHTTTGLSEIGSVDETNDTREIGDFNQQLEAYDAVNPASEHIPVTRVNGVTTVLSRPTGGIFAGQATLLDLDGWTVEEMALKRSWGIVANLPRASGGREFDRETGTVRQRAYTEAKREFDRRIVEIGKLLDGARHYLQAKTAREKDPALPFVRRDEKLEALIPLLKGETPLLLAASSRFDIRAGVEFAEKQGLKPVILGGAEAGKIAGWLKEKDVPVIYGPVQSLPTEEDDAYDLPYATPAILAKAGVRFCIASANTSYSRNLPFDAGTAVGSGLSEEEALKAVTLYPAQILGVADRVGSLERGKQANLVVTNGNLLDIRTEVRSLFIHGRLIPLESKHTRLYEKYSNRP